MDPVEHALHVVEGPVVDQAEALDHADVHTAELAWVASAADEPADPLVPGAGSGLRGWARRTGAVLTAYRTGLLVVAAIAAVPMHFLAGRVEDTIVAAPALSDLAGGFGLLLLPAMWLAYFAVSALPLVICLAGTVGVVVPAAAEGAVPGPRTVWRLVVFRLRALWLWFAAFGVLAQVSPLALQGDRLGPGVVAPVAVVLGLGSVAGLTAVGVLGCVALIEPGRGLRRAVHLVSIAPTGGLIGAALALTVLPRLAHAVAGSVAASLAAVVCGVLWAVAALVTYAQARRVEGPVTSVSLRRELAAADRD